MNKKIFDKSCGSMIGLAIGDALGVPVEFMPRGSFKPIVSYRDGGKFNLSAGDYTDNTAMALCLADSLIRNNGTNLQHQLANYTKWLNEGFMSANGGVEIGRYNILKDLRMPYKCIIKQGNLLEEESATFIVNASNTKLVLGSGVSMAFRHHCGNILQQEMNIKLQTIGKLQKGDVVATSSGNAKNFKYALHVAVMDYNEGVSPEQKAPILQDIRSALKNIEKYVKWYIENKNTKDIKLVLPLMGCGVGGLNKDDVIKLYREFFCRDVAFECEVVIYGYNTPDYKKILKIMMEKPSQ